MSGRDLGYVESRLIRISSTAATGLSSTNFTVQLNSLLKNVKRVSLKTVSFLNNFYNVYANNNTYTFSVNSTPYTGQIPPGWYTSDTLIAALVAVVNTYTASGFTLSQDPISAKVSAGIGGTDTISITPGGPFQLLGFTQAITIAASTSPVIAAALPSLQGLTTAFLRSTILAGGFSYDENGEIGTIFTPIPIKAPFGALNIMECRVDSLCEITFKSPKDLTNIDFQLTDNDNNILDLQGANLRIDLRIYYDVS
jgi:hypothetical protein